MNDLLLLVIFRMAVSFATLEILSKREYNLRCLKLAAGPKLTRNKTLTARPLNPPLFNASGRSLNIKLLKQSLVNAFQKQLEDHERKFGIPVPDKAAYIEAPWPKNVLQHVLSAYHQRSSFMGSLSRSRTSLNFMSTTPHLDRRRSISPNANTKSIKRDKLAKAQKYGSTSNLKLVTEKVSGFSVFSGSDLKRTPIMAYGDQVPKEMSVREMEDPTTLDRAFQKNDKKYNRQSMSENLFKLTHEQPSMKRSISQQSLKQDIALEAVMIDLPSLEGGRYDTMKSSSTLGSSRDGSEADYDLKGFSRWGPVRGSNSYSNSSDVPVSQLSTLNLKRTIVNDKSDNNDSVV